MTGIQFEIVLGVLLVLQLLSTFVLKSVLQNIIKFEFKKREQAAIVASLFAEWIASPIEHKDLNRLTWEATLWLPDNIALEVNKRLANKPDAKDMKEILVDIKGLIHGRKSKMNPMDIVHYPK